MITIIAKFILQSGSVNKVKEELLKMTEPTYKEKGCVDYIFYEDPQNTALLMLYENWKSEEDLNAHMNSSHFKNCFSEIEGLYQIEVYRLTRID